MTSDETGSNSFPDALTWYPCNDDNSLAESFGVPGFRGYLPFLMDEYESTARPEEKHLLLGILYGRTRLKKGEAASVPNNRDQNEILNILQEERRRNPDEPGLAENRRIGG